MLRATRFKLSPRFTKNRLTFLLVVYLGED